MERRSRYLLRIGVERGYFDEDLAEQVATESQARRCSPERVLVERQILSVRRLERLHIHVRFRTQRKRDKLYAKIATRKNLVDEVDVRKGLSRQRRVFEKQRTLIRLGDYFVERGLLDASEDRAIRSKLAQRFPEENANEASSAATLPLANSSMIAQTSRGTSSYEAIENAIQRVDEIRSMEQDLSNSANNLEDEASPDSASEYLNACQALARRRVRSSEQGKVAAYPARPRSELRKSKSGFGKRSKSGFGKKSKSRVA